MWNNAEVVALLDEQGYVRAISRNEEEAVIRNVIGMRIIEERAVASCKQATLKAFDDALNGKETELEVGAIADDGHITWSKVRLKPSPVTATPVFLHARGLPDSWGVLSEREKDIVSALHQTQMNPKLAAKQLGITLNTFNAHRRAITQKCDLQGVGDFWIFVERCR
jgi:DNA-binding CsgD family transcriptional regulator